MTIRTDSTENFFWITLDKGPLNILDGAELAALDAAVESAAQSSAQVVIFSSSEESRVFCAGLDLKAMAAGESVALTKAFNSLLKKIMDCPQVVVAAVDGAAMGAGMQLALAADLVIASNRAVFGLPETQLGTIAPAAMALLPSLVGHAGAADLILTAEAITAEHAEHMGFISRLVGHESFAEELRVLLSTLQNKSPGVLRAATAALRQDKKDRLAGQLGEAQEKLEAELLGAPEFKEGVAAFLEKR